MTSSDFTSQVQEKFAELYKKTEKMEPEFQIIYIASNIDNHLRRLIETYFIPDPSGKYSYASLFNGALQSISSKNQLLHLLGRTDDHFVKCLGHYLKIRNRLAHDIDTFEVNIQKDSIDNLHYEMLKSNSYSTAYLSIENSILDTVEGEDLLQFVDIKENVLEQVKSKVKEIPILEEVESIIDNEISNNQNSVLERLKSIFKIRLIGDVLCAHLMIHVELKDNSKMISLLS